MLNWKVTYPKHKSTGNVCAACKGLVTSLMADTGVTVPSAANIGTSAAFESEGENLGDATFAALKKQELSQRIKYNYVSDTLYYEVWQGLDRTQDQTYNAFATFSQNYGMIDGMALTLDSSALCNYAVVTYTDPASGNDISMNVDLRSSSSLPKRILYVATGMSKDDDQSTSDFLAAVESEARTQLADYVSTTTLDVKVLQKNLIYRQDYDLGDKCDIQDDRLKLAYKALIIEIAEVWKDNQHSVEITFGDKVKTNYARYLRKRKK